MSRAHSQSIFGVVSIAIASLFTSGCILNGYEETEEMVACEQYECSVAARGEEAEAVEAVVYKMPVARTSCIVIEHDETEIEPAKVDNECKTNGDEAAEPDDTEGDDGGKNP